MIAQVDPAAPVLFLDTGKHFPETLAYRDTLVARFGLTDVRLRTWKKQLGDISTAELPQRGIGPRRT